MTGSKISELAFYFSDQLKQRVPVYFSGGEQLSPSNFNISINEKLTQNPSDYYIDQ